MYRVQFHFELEDALLIDYVFACRVRKMLT